MPDYSSHQKKIINRYYDNRSNIMLEKLSDLVTELYLADSDKQRDRLWERVSAAMINLKVPAKTASHILTSRSPELLASHVKDWLQKPPSAPNRQ